MRYLVSMMMLAVAGLAFAAEPPKGFTHLFNGKDLTGWHGWDIHAKGGSPARSRKNVTPRIARRKSPNGPPTRRSTGASRTANSSTTATAPTSPPTRPTATSNCSSTTRPCRTADSGIYLHGTPQVQIWDSRKRPSSSLGADKGSGGLWNNPKARPAKTRSCWPTSRSASGTTSASSMVGERVTVWLNDKLVVDHARLENFWDRARLPLPKAGADPAADPRRRNPLAEHLRPRDSGRRGQRDSRASKANAGLTSIFNGKDLDGWAGAVDGYEVEDGAITCKPKKGGNAATRRKSTPTSSPGRIQASARRQQRPRHPLPRHRRLRLHRHVRTPGARRRRQAVRQDRPAPGPRLAPTAWSPPHRGYLRPVGEWNFEDVTVKGPRSSSNSTARGFSIAIFPRSRSTWPIRSTPAKTIRKATSASSATMTPWRSRM